MTKFKYTDGSNTIVHVIDDDGISRSSCLASVLPQDCMIQPADPAPPPERRIRDWEFRDRFTQSELMAIVSAAYAGDDTARFVLLKIQTASDGVNLDSPEVVGGLEYLVLAGVITSARKLEILA